MVQRPHDERRRAREAALQMLYQWEVGRTEPDLVVQSFWAGHGATAVEETRAFANELVHGTIAVLGEIDPLIAGTAEHWRLARMEVMDRLIMRLAVYEFLRRPETPRRVVINEALELAKRFSNDDAVRFINGVLDGIRRKLEQV
jgi:N utilization substance protein B